MGEKFNRFLCFIGLHDTVIDNKITFDQLLKEYNLYEIKKLITDPYNKYPDLINKHCKRCSFVDNQIDKRIDKARKGIENIAYKEIKCDRCGGIYKIKERPFIVSNKIEGYNISYHFCSEECFFSWKSLLIPIPCPECKGKGRVSEWVYSHNCQDRWYSTHSCSLCSGKGKILSPKNNYNIG